MIYKIVSKNCELVNVLEEAAVAYFRVISQHFPAECRETRKKKWTHLMFSLRRGFKSTLKLVVRVVVLQSRF